MIIRCKIYFVFFIFVVCANHENIFTTKISDLRYTSYTCNILGRFTVHVDGVTGRARGSFALKNGIYHVIHEQDLM